MAYLAIGCCFGFVRTYCSGKFYNFNKKKIVIEDVKIFNTFQDRYDMRLNELICQFNSNIIFNMTCNHIHQKSGIQTISIDVHTRTVIHSLGVTARKCDALFEN